MEGKTSLMALSFPADMSDLTGYLPVNTQPESARSGKLTEPQPLFFYTSRNAGTARAILTAPLDVVEGVYTASIAGRQEQADLHWNIKYFIRYGNYHEATLAVDKSFTEPTPELVARMRHDFETTKKVVQRRTHRAWDASFTPPVSGPDRNNFGDKRTYNEMKHSRHAGLDYKAEMGTPVSAINDGVVAFSDEQLVPGQTIWIDHGGGVFSRYMHLSQRNVREADVVRRGDIIGLSGNSGGQKPLPHLHLDLVVNGTHVDPKDFMRTASHLLWLEAQDRESYG
ncbi:MAG TPA: M23 family metallopeptidase [Pyrinomonadaceae bacterium]|nr:M23 family metallopeptidase [Pyrinomonadaceae bacterium]